MAKTNITFSQDSATGHYIGKFSATDACKLHLEGEGGVITLLQKDPDGTNYDPCHVWANKSTLDTSIADANEIYPVDIEIICTFKPTQAFYRLKE